MKRWLNIICAVIFFVVCAGIGWFLLQFTESAPPFDYPVWEEGVVVAADGSETSFDVSGMPPALEEGERLRVSLTMPEGRANGDWLIFETAGLECAVFLDGEELWYSNAVQDDETVNMSQAYLPLPEGGGELLEMELRQTGPVAMILPVVRLTADPTDQAGAIAYANHYGIPAGISALALALLCGMFLISLAQRKPNWRLLLPALAAAVLTMNDLALGYGEYFLPAWLQAVASIHWLTFVSPLLLLLYLVLQRDRAFWKNLVLASLWSVLGLGAAYAVSAAHGGYLSRYLSDELVSLQSGYYQGLLSWFTLWLIVINTVLTAWSLMRSMANTETEAQTMALKNQLMLENIQSLEQQLRDNAASQHEISHRLAALDVMLRSGDLEGLTASLSAWKDDNQQASQPRFSDNLTINAILQDAAMRAETAGITFNASALVPQTLAVSDEDLCILLMNMLDNAIEAAGHTPDGQERMIHIQLRSTNGFLAILCENSYDGKVLNDDKGEIISRKSDPRQHGFGLAQMRRIAEKYGSILDIRTNDRLFIVQTALKLPKE